MTAGGSERLREASAISGDGTTIGYCSLGEGPGLVVVGGVLSRGSEHLALAQLLAQDFEVHVMDRRGRPKSGPQRPGHSVDDECADLIAVAQPAARHRAHRGHSRFRGCDPPRTGPPRPSIPTQPDCRSDCREPRPTPAGSLGPAANKIDESDFTHRLAATTRLAMTMGGRNKEPTQPAPATVRYPFVADAGESGRLLLRFAAGRSSSSALS